VGFGNLSCDSLTKFKRRRQEALGRAGYGDLYLNLTNSVGVERLDVRVFNPQLEILSQILNGTFEIVICFGAGWIDF
jgi:hypothetical protein